MVSRPGRYGGLLHQLTPRHESADRSATSSGGQIHRGGSRASRGGPAEHSDEAAACTSPTAPQERPLRGIRSLAEGIVITRVVQSEAVPGAGDEPITSAEGQAAQVVAPHQVTDAARRESQDNIGDRVVAQTVLRREQRGVPIAHFTPDHLWRWPQTTHQQPGSGLVARPRTRRNDRQPSVVIAAIADVFPEFGSWPTPAASGRCRPGLPYGASLGRRFARRTGPVTGCPVLVAARHRVRDGWRATKGPPVWTREIVMIGVVAAVLAYIAAGVVAVWGGGAGDPDRSGPSRSTPIRPW
jgi:hypothetical protein